MTSDGFPWRRSLFGACVLLVLGGAGLWALERGRGLARETDCDEALSRRAVDFCTEGGHGGWLSSARIDPWPNDGDVMMAMEALELSPPATEAVVAVVRAIHTPLVVTRQGSAYTIAQPGRGVLTRLQCDPAREFGADWWRRWLTGADVLSLRVAGAACAKPSLMPVELSSLIGPLDDRRMLAVCEHDAACGLDLAPSGGGLQHHVLPTVGTPGSLLNAQMVREGQAALEYGSPGCVTTTPAVECVTRSATGRWEAVTELLAAREAATMPNYHRYGGKVTRRVSSPDGTMTIHFDTNRLTYRLVCDDGRVVDLFASWEYPGCDEGDACVFWAGASAQITLQHGVVMFREARLRHLCRRGPSAATSD